MMKGKRFSERGQIIFPVLGLFIVLILALTLVIDFGRFFLLRSRVRTIADTAALAGAGALDIRQSTTGDFAVNASWARDRSQEVYQQTLARNPRDTWMAISLEEVSVDGPMVTVTVTGTCEAIWGGLFGIHHFSTSVTSAARAAVGITTEH